MVRPASIKPAGDKRGLVCGSPSCAAGVRTTATLLTKAHALPNVGSKADFEFQIGFLHDLAAATREARNAEAFSKHMNPNENNHAAFARSQRDAIIKRVTEQLRPKYGRMYGYDASMPYNVELAIRLIGSYY